MVVQLTVPSPQQSWSSWTQGLFGFLSNNQPVGIKDENEKLTSSLHETMTESQELQRKYYAKKQRASEERAEKERYVCLHNDVVGERDGYYQHASQFQKDP